MFTLRSIISYDLNCRRCEFTNQDRLSSLSPSKSKFGCRFPANNRGLLLLNTSSRPGSESQRSEKMDTSAYCAPLPSLPSSSNWQVWVLGGLILAILPFCKQKWGNLLPIKKEVDKVLDETDKVAELVNEVAEKVEKITDKIADELPQGKAEDAVRLIEKIAKETADDAEAVEEIIHKVEELEDELKNDSKSPAPMDKENVNIKENTNRSKL